MSPITHFLTGWLVANTSKAGKRERMLITIAGIIPDVDGFVIIGDFLTRNSNHPLHLWGDFHHVLAHNLGFAILVTIVGYLLAKKRKITTAFLVWISFHIHLLGDILGGRGPEGYQWPIPYLLPFSNSWQLAWKGQWALNAWPNFIITGVALFFTLFLAWKRGFSPLEMISCKADKLFIKTLHKRFGEPRNTKKIKRPFSSHSE
ncbi:MAG: metal-dependent hydrolase [Deltaproteobacteria bacterium]|nr:metal-dependent hydrolase [Deltaproteobacteria bacterium]